MPSTKISALAAASAVSGGELLPAVQAGGNVAITPAQLRAHALAGLPPLIGRPFAKLMVDGDSKRGEPVAAARWANARTPLDVAIGTHDFGTGGSTSGTTATTGLTNATRIAAMQAAVATESAAGTVCDMLLTIGTNDIGLNGTAPETVIANVRRYHNLFRAAGGRFLIIMAMDPRTGLSAAQARQAVALNHGYADYARAFPDAIFCDATPWWLDPAAGNVSHLPIGAATGAAFAMAADGLHANAYGCYRKQHALAPLLQAIYRPRPRHPLHGADAFNASDAPRGNILGANGRMVSLGGAPSFTNSGTGTISGTPPAGWTGSGTLTGDVALSFAGVTSPALETYAGSSGWQAVRLTLSGTPTASGGISLARNVVLAAQGSTPMLGTMLAHCNALTGCFGLTLTTVNVTPTATGYLGSSATPASLVAADQLPGLDGLHGIDIAVTPTSNSNSGLSFGLRWLAGVPLSGSIDLIGAVWRRADALPAAAV